MKVLVGLGNPGREYLRTRHNVGFMVAEAVAESWHIPFRRKKFGAVYGEGTRGDERVLICKPQQYMNCSGEVVAALCNFYRIAPDTLCIIHDDVDLMLGQLKFARGRGAAGHNGVTSIIAAMGTTTMDRLRVGIGRPPRGHDIVNYVLEPFGRTEHHTVSAMVQRAVAAIEAYVEHGMQWAMDRFHRGEEIV